MAVVDLGTNLGLSRTMSYPGALAPPPGVVPDLNNPRDVLWTCNFVTQALAIVIVSSFVCTRFYVKIKVLEPTLDDCKSN